MFLPLTGTMDTLPLMMYSQLFDQSMVIRTRVGKI